MTSHRDFNDAPTCDMDRRTRIRRLLQDGMRDMEQRYDPQRQLVGQAGQGQGTNTFWPPDSIWYAHSLLAQGKDVDRATGILEAALHAQERSPVHPRRGNWKWRMDDPEVVDLNAVQFVMRAMLPLLVRFGDRLPADLYARCEDAVDLSLEEEERLDVDPAYTNIHLMSLFALIVGGEWLGKARWRDLGKERWSKWIRFTAGNGAPFEYACPSYIAVDLSCLAALISLTKDEAVRLQARLFYERFWLHLIMRLHMPTGQVAGPHARCYWPFMTTGLSPARELLWRETGWDWLVCTDVEEGDSIQGKGASIELALTEHLLPEYLVHFLKDQDKWLPFSVLETADKASAQDATTFLSDNYALGTASRSYQLGTDCHYIEHQANSLILHYRRPGNVPGWGTAYCRYVVNDRHWGTYGAAPDRPKTYNFYDHGNFAGAQSASKAIGLYSLLPEQEEVHSLKTVVAFDRGRSIGEIRINEWPVDMENLPVPLMAGDWLTVADGAVLVGVNVLAPSQLGAEAPVQLEWGPCGELWLVIYNYLGPPKRFWEYASLKGPFWKSNLRAGFIMDVADRESFSDSASFARHLMSARITDSVDEHHIRTVSYQSGGEDLTLQLDLARNMPVGRALNGVPIAPAMLSSPVAVQGDSGDLRLGEARLTSRPHPCWLVSGSENSKTKSWMACNPFGDAGPFRFETPAGTVEAESWPTGRLEIRLHPDGKSRLHADCMTPLENLKLTDGIILGD
jgi:hypothetical protein